MQYVQPIGGAPGDPYIDAEPGASIEGSAVPAAAIEGPMRELVALIENAGLTPDGGDLGQVTGAVRSLIQKLSPAVAGAGGTANALTGTYVPAVTALTNGMTLSVRAGAANTTTNPTFAADGTAPKVIVKGNNLPLAAGDIAGAGFWAQMRYDAALDKWVLMNPATGIISVFQQPGEICYFARSSPPSGFLKANGAAVSRTTYSALFAIFGTSYGAGDGATTFNLPDLRGEFIRGWDDSRGVDAGRAFGSGQADLLASHTHGIGQAQTSGSNLANNERTIYPDNIGGSTLFATYTGGGETRPRNIALLACIKF